MRVPELKSWLQEYHLTPTKSFGQHFLCHEPTLTGIASAVVGKNVLEIGPGAGCLTWHLAQPDDRQLIVVEKDPKFQALLHARIPGAQWVCQDALELDWSLYKDFFVASNLPYNISVPLMLHYAEHAYLLKGAVFMMQKEVADRVMAKTHTKEYGRLSVLMQTYVDMQWLMDVPPSAFWPKPLVDSAVLICTPKNPWPNIVFKKLSSLVAQSFSSRRQMLHHNVHVSKAVWEKSGIDSRRRAETLEKEEFAVLLQAIAGQNNAKKEVAHVEPC